MIGSQIGKLYGISAGPGDPELITVKGLQALRRVPVVTYPSGSNGQSGVAQRIIEPWLMPNQIQIALQFPFVQDSAVLNQAWKDAAEKVWLYLSQGQDVAFVSEGDVSFYSTFTYLAQMLQHLHPEAVVEAIPGVCSPMAATAMLGIPITVQAQRLMVLPALYTVSDLETALAIADVVVLLKVSSVYEKVWAILQQHGLLQQSFVVERATHPDQVIYADLSDRPQLDLSYFSLLVIQVRPSDVIQAQP